MKRTCPRCGQPGHYRKTCSNVAQKIKSRDASSPETRAMVDAIREVLGLKPLYGSTETRKPSSLDPLDVAGQL